MARTWSLLLDEVGRAARQAPRMYFAPFIGAVRETCKVLNEIQRENRSPPIGQASGPEHHPESNA